MPIDEVRELVDAFRLSHFFLGETDHGNGLVFRQTKNIPHPRRDRVELVGAQVEVTARYLEKKDGRRELELAVRHAWSLRVCALHFRGKLLVEEILDGSEERLF